MIPPSTHAVQESLLLSQHSDVLFSLANDLTRAAKTLILHAHEHAYRSHARDLSGLDLLLEERKGVSSPSSADSDLEAQLANDVAVAAMTVEAKVSITTILRRLLEALSRATRELTRAGSMSDAAQDLWQAAPNVATPDYVDDDHGRPPVTAQNAMFDRVVATARAQVRGVFNGQDRETVVPLRSMDRKQTVDFLSTPQSLIDSNTTNADEKAGTAEVKPSRDHSCSVSSVAETIYDSHERQEQVWANSDYKQEVFGQWTDEKRRWVVLGAAAKVVDRLNLRSQ